MRTCGRIMALVKKVMCWSDCRQFHGLSPHVPHVIVSLWLLSLEPLLCQESSHLGNLHRRLDNAEGKVSMFGCQIAGQDRIGLDETGHIWPLSREFCTSFLFFLQTEFFPCWWLIACTVLSVLSVSPAQACSWFCYRQSYCCTAASPPGALPS